MSGPGGVVAADPDALDAHAAAVAPADDALRAALVEAMALAERWAATPSSRCGRVDVDALLAAVRALDALGQLEVWLGEVALAVRRADGSGSSGVVTVAATALAGVGPPRLAPAGGRWSSLVEVVRDVPGRARVVRLALDRRPVGITAADWDAVVGGLVLDGARGPVHLVIHGWGTTTAGAAAAGRATADLYDEQSVDGATVVVVDWDAGAGAGGLGTVADFTAAERASRTAGEDLAGLLQAVAARRPAGPVVVTAHSLGAEVASRALTAVEDPTGRFGVDLVLLQPALPAAAVTTDPAHAALLDGRVRDLTVTVSEGDDALWWYERRGPDALGDEAVDGQGLVALVAARSAHGLDTDVVAHRSDAGHGHLGLRPGADQGLVTSLTQEAIDRARGDRPQQAELRRWIARRWPDRSDAIIDLPAVERYLASCQRAGLAPTRGAIEALVASVGLEGPPLPRPAADRTPA